MARSAIALLGLIVLLVPRWAAPDGQPPGAAGTAASTGDAAKLVDMLRDPLLWGPGKSAVLDSVPAFAQASEAQIEILPRRVVGRHKYKNSAEAEQPANRALNAMKALPRMRVQVAAPQEDAQLRTLGSVAAVVFPDDRTVRVGTPVREAQYIASNVRIDQVEQRFGKAERVTTEVIDDGTDRRPIELKLYHFAKDAIIVVTADYNSDPRTVDRVLLDTKAVMQAIF